MILSEVFYRGSLMTYGGAGTWRPDPMRLAAGILAGIGFIGGGVILKQDHLVRGVTTAAVLWVSTLLGLVFGAGHFTLGAMGLILSVITLLGFPYLEKFVYNDWYSELSITTSPVPFSAETAKRLLNARGIAVKNVQVDSDTAIPTHILTLQLKHKKRDLLLLPQQVRDDFLALEGVMRVQWK
jgi:putative Mg2+ transporter-C (MgtC) family protein